MKTSPFRGMLVLALFLAGSLLHSSCPSLACETTGSGEGKTGHFVETRRIEIDLESIGATHCVDKVGLDSTVLAVCNLNGKDTRTDYGLRLLLVKLRNGEPELKWQSQGAMDAYSGKLNLLRPNPEPEELLVVVDYSSEFAYGSTWYLLKDNQVRSIGRVDAVKSDANGDIVSATPDAVLKSVGKGFKITYSSPVLLPDKKGDYRKYGAGRLAYIYDGKKLRLAIK